MKKRITALLATLTILGGLVIAFMWDSRANITRVNSDVVIAGDESSFEIVELEDNILVVNDISNIHVGSIIASEATENIPYGCLLKVEAIESVDGGYRLTTRQAALTEAIDRCDIDFELTVENNGVVAAEVTDNLAEHTVLGSILGTKVARALDIPIEINKFQIWNFKDASKLDFDNALTVESTGYFTLSGRIVIDWGKADVSVLARLYADISGKTNSQEFDLLEESFEKALALPKAISVITLHLPGSLPLPIVLNNNVTFGFECKAAVLTGGIEFKTALDRTIGYRYTTDSGLSLVNEPDNSKPLELIHGPTLKSEMDVEMYAKLGTYIYDFSGLEGRVGLLGELDAEVGVLDAEGEESQRFYFEDIIKRLGGKADIYLWVPMNFKFACKKPGWDNFNIFDATELDKLGATIAETKREEWNTIYEQHVRATIGDSTTSEVEIVGITKPTADNLEAPELTFEVISDNNMNRQVGAKLVSTGEKLIFIAQEGIVESLPSGADRRTLVAGSSFKELLLEDGRLYYVLLDGASSKQCSIHTCALDGTDDKVLLTAAYSGFAPYVYDGALYYMAITRGEDQYNRYELFQVALDGSHAESIDVHKEHSLFAGFSAVSFANGKMYRYEGADESFTGQLEVVAYTLPTLNREVLTTVWLYPASWIAVTDDETLYLSQVMDGGEGSILKLMPGASELSSVYELGSSINLDADSGYIESFYPLDAGCYVFPHARPDNPFAVQSDVFTVYEILADGSQTTISDSFPYPGALLVKAGNNLYAYDGDIHAIAGPNAEASTSPSSSEESPSDEVPFVSGNYQNDYFSLNIPDGMMVAEVDTSPTGNPVLVCCDFFYLNSRGKMIYETYIDVTDSPSYEPYPGAIELASTSQGYRVFLYGIRDEPIRELADSYQPK